MLWKPRQRDTFTAHTTCEASESVMLQTCQVLSVSVNVGPAYAGALALMSSFRAYSGFWIVLGTLFNVKFWGQNC